MRTPVSSNDPHTVDDDRSAHHEMDDLQEQVLHLTTALANSRTIGIAVGIVMATRRCDKDQAFEEIRQASQQANRKVSDLADDIVETGQLPLGAAGPGNSRGQDPRNRRHPR